MRIVVFSDTHGRIAGLEKAVFQQPRADIFIHLGDGEGDYYEIFNPRAGARYLAVAGNCDYGSQLPCDGEEIIAGRRIFYTHGHRYGVKWGYGAVIEEALKRRADILLFGHTHVPYTSYENGLYIMNPGSLAYPRASRLTYGVLDITAAGVVTNIVDL